ncbi:BPTI Kunitz domain-containing -like protein [Labeo rohita]|uniref:BPTI Kunitz domain-containing-like protein n=2 Tax=Labeo rohita TaxID=84645 RepID=A0A498L9S5_LABRO|nr:boophilin-H2 [Labeo rohita]KAI2660211.1 Kunitz-type U19-barytoxin-Tl1a [Labeo rohita]RXN04908.1 BPTI Kunitz domain-containing -like protein [Labeo rohita]
MRRTTLYVLLVILGFGGVFAQSGGPECSQPKDEGTGKETMLKFFYDPKQQVCVPFFYKGEGGNDNRFNTDKDCMIACSAKGNELYPDEDAVCSLPKDEGDCLAIIPRFYYDSEEKNCRMFLYKGCRGNGNRFNTREECHKMCLARSGRLLGAADVPNPDESSVNAGLIVGVLGGIVFAGALISLIVVFVLRKKSKKGERKPVPTTDIEMK